jgi:hypothetical protein
VIRFRSAAPGILPVLAFLAAGATLALAAPAAAQSRDTDRQIAQQLFDDGRDLLEAKRYAEACPKFAESQRLDPGGGTLVNLAYCHELEGKTATAWAEFRDALGQALKDDRKDREEFTRAHIADLAPRLMRVVVRVPEPLAARDPEVTLDKSRLSPAAWGTPLPVDPGEHQVTLALRGVQPVTTRVSATEPGETYTVDLSSPEAPIECPEHHARVQGTCVPIPWEATSRPRTTAFWLTLGGAGVLLATSAATGIAALSADAYVKNHCSTERDFCDVGDAGDAATRAKTFAWISTATLGAGVVAGVVAFVLPREKPATFGGGTVTLGLGTLRITGM